MVIKFLNPRANPTFCTDLCLIQVKFRLQIVECFSYHFLIVREHMRVCVQRLFYARVTEPFGHSDDCYPFMNQKRSTGVAQITGTDPFDISDAHYEMKSHIIYSINTFTLRQLSCPVF